MWRWEDESKGAEQDRYAIDVSRIKESEPDQLAPRWDDDRVGEE